jgi:hypothetical protein
VGWSFGCQSLLTLSKELAGTTGLEPAASAVTGQRSNQLNYVPTCVSSGSLETLDFRVFSYVYRVACFHHFHPT